jgi:Domain of unknown function (DUF4920)
MTSLYLQKKAMKHLYLFVIFVIFSCGKSEENTETIEVGSSETTSSLAFYGESIDPSGAAQMSEVLEMVYNSGSTQTKIEGEITSACQKKGCWLKLDVEGYEEPIRVTFKDYGFFVPKNSASNWAVVEGKAYLDTLSVETLRHYAEDAGKSEEEIMAITEPDISLAFEAHGVAIKEVKGEE